MHAEQAGFSHERLDRLSRLLKGYVDRQDLPCASAVVARRGVTVYREKFGWQDLEAAKPIQFDTIFRIMSMTKPVTAVAAMLLYEEGRFDLNTPIHRFLPAFKDMKVLLHREKDGALQVEEARAPVTFRHLFTHTSGISYGSLPDDPLDALYMETLNPMDESARATTIQSFVERLAKLPLAFQPGSRFRYGYNLDVLGALIEVIADMPLADFLEARIFRPLGMVDTGFTLPHEKCNRLATVYGRDAQSGAFVRRDIPLPLPVQLWGGGGLVSTLDDYAKFAAMLANRGAFDGLILLSPTTVAMFGLNWADPQSLPSFWENSPEINAGYGYSLGTAVLMDPAPTGRFGNPGEFYWGGAFSTYFWIDPKESLYGIFMTQFDPNWAYPIPWQFKQLVYQAMIH